MFSANVKVLVLVVDIYVCPVEELLVVDVPRSVSVVAWSPQQTAPHINYSEGGDTNISLPTLGTAPPGISRTHYN